MSRRNTKHVGQNDKYQGFPTRYDLTSYWGNYRVLSITSWSSNMMTVVTHVDMVDFLVKIYTSKTQPYT